METKTKNSDNKDHNLETEYAAWWSRSLSWGKRHPREVGDREDKEGWLVTTNGVTWDAKSMEYLDVSEYPLEYLYQGQGPPHKHHWTISIISTAIIITRLTSTHVSLPGATSRFDTLREGKSLGPPNTTSAA